MIRKLLRRAALVINAELIVALLIVLVMSSAQATERNTTIARQFRKANPCPATGKIQVSCPGYVVDHIVPLCAGGPDTVDNMMWQSRSASYRKDVLERAICRRLTVCEKK